MNASAGQKIKIGMFVIVSILVLVAGIFLIGSKRNMFSDTFSVYGTFRNAGGLQVGNEVRFGGVNVGTVKSIQILTDTVVRVDMILQASKHEFIKADAVASVGSDGLMGDKTITIAPGQAGTGLIATGGRINTMEPVDFANIIDKFSRVASNAEVITGALAGMAIQIKNGDGTISRLLYKNDLAMGLEGTVNNARSITGSLQTIATDIRSGKGSLGSLIYTDSLSKGLEHAVNTASNTLVSVQKAADNFGENMKALQGNYFLKGYFKKKLKAQADSAKANQDEEEEMDDAQLMQIRADADAELLRRKARINNPAKGG